MAASRLDRGLFLGLAALILLGIAVRILSLPNTIFSIDDIYTATIIRPPTSFDSLVLERAIRIEANPPLYYLLAAAWQAVVGIGEIKLKALSATLGILAIVAAFLMGRGLFPRRVLWLQAALLACSYGAIVTGHAARPYALLLLFGVVLTCLYFAAERALREDGDIPAWRLLAISLVGVLAAHTHYFGLIFAGAVFAALLLQLLWRRKFGGALKVVGFGLLTLALFLPWLLHEVPRQQRIAEEISLFWFPERAGDYFAQVITFAAYLGGSSYGAFLLFLAFLIALWVNRARLTQPEALPRSRAIAHCAALSAIALALVLLLNLAAPLSFARYFVVLLPALYLGVACAFDLWLDHAAARGWRWRGPVPVLLLTALLLQPTWRFFERPINHSAQAVDFVTEALGCRQGAVPTYQAAEFPDGLVAFNYYLERKGTDLRAETVERTDGRLARPEGVTPECRLVVWIPTGYLRSGDLAARLHRDLGVGLDPQSLAARQPFESRAFGDNILIYQPDS